MRAHAQLQRQHGIALSAAQHLSVVHKALNAPGRPLESGARTAMESRFGYDFSRVRVHTDARAAESARSVKARAYTVGNDVVFGEGQYANETAAGRHLLAHELTHVVQQNKRGTVALQRQPQGQPTPASEADELKKTGEQIRQQIDEAKEDLEVLDLALWEGYLQGKSLPGTGTAVGKDTAAFVEALIKTSKFLRPFLHGKVAKISLSTGFKIYDTRPEFERKERELSGRTEVKPFTGASEPNKQLHYGFYHRRTDSIHLSSDAKFGHALHEGIHKFSSVAMQKALGEFLNEGFTQHFADFVQDERSIGGFPQSSYEKQLACARIVRRWINNDDRILARAYFQGEGVNEVLNAVLRKLGIQAAELVKLANGGEGEDLCERIKDKGS
jgi:hypothetical protein